MAAEPAPTTELFIRYAREDNRRFITAVYTTEPIDPDIHYTRMCFKNKDIPYLRVSQVATYNEDEMYDERIIYIQYLHYKGLALDIHPEVGTLPQKWFDNKAVENGYFDHVTLESVQYYSYDCIRVVRNPTTHMLTNIYSIGKSNAIQFEKISSIPLPLDVFKEDGFYVEYPAETKLYGLILKGGLEVHNNAEGIIMAFGPDPAVLAQLDTSVIDEKPNCWECVVRELLAINWLGETKPGHQFYAIQNRFRCEGVVYMADEPNKDDTSFSRNPLEMNTIYPDGIMNA